MGMIPVPREAREQTGMAVEAVTEVRETVAVKVVRGLVAEPPVDRLFLFQPFESYRLPAWKIVSG